MLRSMIFPSPSCLNRRVTTEGGGETLQTLDIENEYRYMCDSQDPISQLSNCLDP